MEIELNCQPSIIPRINEKNEGKVIEIDAVEDTRQCSEESANPRIFAKIAKISLGLQKFRNLSENFAILAKLSIFARHQDFR